MTVNHYRKLGSTQISEWKFRTFSGLFRTGYTEQSAPTFTPFQASTYEFDSKTRHCKTTCNSLFVDNDKRECNTTATKFAS